MKMEDMVSPRACCIWFAVGLKRICREYLEGLPGGGEEVGVGSVHVSMCGASRRTFKGGGMEGRRGGTEEGRGMGDRTEEIWKGGGRRGRRDGREEGWEGERWEERGRRGRRDEKEEGWKARGMGGRRDGNKLGSSAQLAVQRGLQHG